MSLRPDIRELPGLPEAAPTHASLAERDEPRRLFSEQLIGPGREVLIRHAGCDYRLRITRQGKLILTK